MEHEFDYYFIRNTFEGGTVPRLMVDDEVNPSGTSFLSLSIMVPESYVAHLCFGSPVPPKPSLDVDGLFLEGKCCVFSKKIVNAINSHNFKGIQFVPTVIRGKDDEEFNDFCIANVFQKIDSFDPQKTQFRRINKLTKKWDGITKIALDKELFSNIPLNNRLVFVANEHPRFVLYHKTIVDVINSTNPNGLIIIPVEEWYEGIQFQ